MLRKYAFVLLAVPAATAAFAEVVACPDLAGAAQVGACPSEEELSFTFSGYCSDNARIYNWQEDTVCTDYALYRRFKNVALWEARSGDFQGYLSCDLPPARIRAARPTGIAVSIKGKLTRVACSYGPDIIFAYRTRGQCKVEDGGDCAATPDACRAVCD